LQTGSPQAPALVQQVSAPPSAQSNTQASFKQVEQGSGQLPSSQQAPAAMQMATPSRRQHCWVASSQQVALDSP
jgi:hypothetical protein